MDPRSVPIRQRRLPAIDAVMVMVIVLLIVQMWLLTATVEFYLAGHTTMLMPATICSGVLFAAVVALYRFIRRTEKV